MNTYATQEIVQAHIAELHRTAAQHRRARAAAGPSPLAGLALRRTWGATRQSMTAWVRRTRALTARTAAAEPVCCPA